MYVKSKLYGRCLYSDQREPFLLFRDLKASHPCRLYFLCLSTSIVVQLDIYCKRSLNGTLLQMRDTA